MANTIARCEKVFEGKSLWTLGWTAIRRAGLMADI